MNDEYVYDNELRTARGEVLGKFSSHWAACAAMLRRSDPSFRSLGGDRPEDLAVEAEIRKLERKEVITDMVNRRGLLRNPAGVISTDPDIT